jgi:ABC-type antimicrobial peptide transport system permease subunit
MFRNYFKIALRNLKRNKAYAFINVIGLSLGIACSILIFTVVTYHLSFDNFHHNKERIYRIVSNYHYEGGIEHQQGVQQPLGKVFRNDYSFNEKVARAVYYNNALILLPDEKQVKKFNEDKGVAFAEPEFFDIFNFPLIEGDQKTALTEPNCAIITEQIAKKYFGNEIAIGKTISYSFSSKKIDCKITGVLKDFPANTDRKQEIYISYLNLKDRDPRLAKDDNWGSVRSSMQCFVLLKPGVSKTSVEKVFPAFIKKYLGPGDAGFTDLILQPLSDIHFNTDYDGYADKKYLWALAFIGIFLIVTACVNFINLATAQALNRSKEVGVRKVLGSMRLQLFWQFIAETSLITLFAVVLAYGFTQLALPYLNDLFQTKMSINIFANIKLALFLLLLIATVVFLSGSYPALVLSRFQPVVALKGKLSQKNIGGFSLRRMLVVAQFAISQMLTIGTIVVASQMHFSKTTDLGFTKDAMVMLPVPQTDSIGKTRMQVLKNRLQQVAGVSNISFCSDAPASESVHATSMRYENRPKDEPFDVSVKTADAEYLPSFAIKMAAGRNFFPSDTAREFLVNEILVKKLGFKNAQDVINKMVVIGDKKGPIIGVVKNFFTQSFHAEIDPICIMQSYSSYNNCAVKINLKDTKPVLASFEKIWNETYPEYLYSYQFLDERIAKFYELDDIMLKLIEAFACIAIFIGCLGLYGLVSFMALQKTKEIGVRKVLGASVQSILWMFGKEFSRLLLVAFIIAAPIAWWTMNKYLQDFKYRINISLGIFVLAILATFIVAAASVGYRSIKAAIANPVKSLRTE